MELDGDLSRLAEFRSVSFGIPSPGESGAKSSSIEVETFFYSKKFVTNGPFRPSIQFASGPP